jgi:hypothetical protein
MVAKVEGEPLKPNSVDEGEAKVVVAEVEGAPTPGNGLDLNSNGFGCSWIWTSIHFK